MAKDINIAGKLNASTVDGWLGEAKQIHVSGGRDAKSDILQKTAQEFSGIVENATIVSGSPTGEYEVRYVSALGRFAAYETGTGVYYDTWDMVEYYNDTETGKALPKVYLNDGVIYVCGSDGEMKAVNIANMDVITNDSFLYAVVDADGYILFGIRTDGSLYAPKGIPDEVQEAIDALQKATSEAIADLKEETSEETGSLEERIAALEDIVSPIMGGDYLFAITDKTGYVVFGVTSDGSLYAPKGMPEETKAALKELNSRLETLEGEVNVVESEYLWAVVDRNNNFLLGIDVQGNLVAPRGIPDEVRPYLEDILKRLGEIEGDDKVGIVESDLLFAVTDCNENVLIGVRTDGTVITGRDLEVNGVVIAKEASVEGDAKVGGALNVNGADAAVVDTSDRLFSLVDKNGNVLLNIGADGKTTLTPQVQIGDGAVENVESETSLFHVVDSHGYLLLNIDKDGNLYAPKSLTLGTSVQIGVEDIQRNFLLTLLDKNGYIVAGITDKGTLYARGIEGDTIALEQIETQDWVFALTDKNDRILLGVDKKNKFFMSSLNVASKTSEISEETGHEFLCVYTDARGYVLWGIRGNGECYQAKGIPEAVRSEIRRLEQLTQNIGTDSAQTEINNNIAINKIMYDGTKGKSCLGNVTLQEPGKTDYCIIMMYGQSLSNGSESTGGFYDAPIDRTYMLGSTVQTLSGSSLQALSVSNSATVYEDRDNWCSGTDDAIITAVRAFANLYMKERPWDTKTKFIACSLGVGGKTVAELSGGKYRDGAGATRRYPTCDQAYLDSRVLQYFESVKAIADAEGASISLSAVFWMQGEADYGTAYIGKDYDTWKAEMDALEEESTCAMKGSKAAYYEGLTILKEDIYALAKQVFGDDQSARPVFMPYSVCGTYISNAYMTIDDATHEMAEAQDDVVQVGPTYQVPDYNGGHLSLNGYRWYGEYCAKALYDVFLRHVNWRPLQPYNYEVRGNAVYVYINACCPPLRIDRYTCGDSYKDCGFTVRAGTVAQLDTATTMTSSASTLVKTITDIAILDDCIVLTCGGEESLETYGAVEVIYAGQGQSGYSGHDQGAGNVRDSDTWTAMHTYRNDTKDFGNRQSYTAYYWRDVAAATDEEIAEGYGTWDEAETYALNERVLFDNGGVTYIATSNADSNKGHDPSSNSDSFTGYYWASPVLATDEELASLEYWDETYASQVGYSYGDEVLYDLINYAGPVKLTCQYLTKTSGTLCTTRPYNLVNYRAQDVKGQVIFGRTYPMQNWLLNFYKRIVQG